MRARTFDDAWWTASRTTRAASRADARYPSYLAAIRWIGRVWDWVGGGRASIDVVAVCRRMGRDTSRVCVACGRRAFVVVVRCTD